MKHNLKPTSKSCKPWPHRTQNTRVREELDVMNITSSPPRTLVNLGLAELTSMPCSHPMTDITSLFQITRYLQYQT